MYLEEGKLQSVFKGGKDKYNTFQKRLSIVAKIALKRQSLGYLKMLLTVYKVNGRTVCVCQCFKCTVSSFIFILESGHLTLNPISATQYVTLKKSLINSWSQFLLFK